MGYAERRNERRVSGKWWVMLREGRKGGFQTQNSEGSEVGNSSGKGGRGNQGTRNAG